MMKKNTKITVAFFSMCVIASVFPQRSLADKSVINTQTFRPSPIFNDLYNVTLGDTQNEQWKWDVGIFFQYQHDPLVLRNEKGEVIRSVVAHQLTADLLGAVSLLEWWDIGLALPVLMYQDGEGLPQEGEPGTGGVGDLRLHTKFRLYHTESGLFSLAFAPIITFPTGKETDQFAGSKGITAEARIATHLNFDRFGFGLNLGYRFVKNEELAGLELYDELLMLLGGWFWVLPDKFEVIAELNAITTASDPFSEVEQSPLEVIFALRGFPRSWIHLDLGIGTGLTQGYATPDVRIFAGVVIAPPAKKAGPVDTDGDGLFDPEDACPLDPEDMDAFKDEDGCPDPDNDGDRVLDPWVIKQKLLVEYEKEGKGSDDCPDNPEDMDAFKDEDGCPDPDNDGDRICDPWVAESSDSGTYAGQCTGVDKCPDKPETINEQEDEDGCPDVKAIVKAEVKVEAKAEVRGKKIVILEKVFFFSNERRIMPKSFPVLDDVVTVMKQHPAIKRIRVEGHTDRRGKTRYNRKLSRGRAKAVMAYLIEHGVEAERVTSRGLGEDRPLVAPEKTEEDFEKNRRVEFVIEQMANDVEVVNK